MKSISASIIVLSSAMIFTGGAFIGHNDTQIFVMGVACVVGIFGLGAWAKSFKME